MTAIIYSITAPTGTGKSVFASQLAESGCPEVVSTTTRAPRPGERDGVDYHFVDDREFRRMVAAGEFLEHATYEGNAYGVTRKGLASALEKSGICCVVLEPIGVASLRRVAPAHGWHLQTIYLRKSRLAIARQLFGRHALKGELREFFTRLRNAWREAQWEKNGSWHEVLEAGSVEIMDGHARRLVAYAEASREHVVPFDRTRGRARPRSSEHSVHIEVEEVHELSASDYQLINAGIERGDLDPWAVGNPDDAGHDAAVRNWNDAGLSIDAATEFVALHPIRPSGSTKTQPQHKSRPLRP